MRKLNDFENTYKDILANFTDENRLSNCNSIKTVQESSRKNQFSFEIKSH